MGPNRTRNSSVQLIGLLTLLLVVLQWLLDCLACLLKLICQFAVDPADLDLAYHDVFAWSGLADSQRKRAWPGKSRKSTVEHGKGLHIPRLTEVKAPPPNFFSLSFSSFSSSFTSSCSSYFIFSSAFLCTSCTSFFALPSSLTLFSPPLLLFLPSSPLPPPTKFSISTPI